MNSLFIPSSHIWNVGLVRDPFDEVNADWILNCSAPLGNLDDKLIWTPDSKGVFLVKSTYQLLSSPANHSSLPFPTEVWRELWAMPMKDRLKLLLWKIAWNALPCKTNTCWFASPTEEELSCSFCHYVPQTLEHLFFVCLIISKGQLLEVLVSGSPFGGSTEVYLIFCHSHGFRMVYQELSCSSWYPVGPTSGRENPHAVQ